MQDRNSFLGKWLRNCICCLEMNSELRFSVAGCLFNYLSAFADWLSVGILGLLCEHVLKITKVLMAAEYLRRDLDHAANIEVWLSKLLLLS